MISMKTIAFITRVHPKRPRMLEVCIDSVKAQTDDDYIHILHRDDNTENGYGVIMANRSFVKVSPIDARYVMILDDDDMLIDSDFVKVFKGIISKNNPEIVFFKGFIVGKEGSYPKEEIWGRSPLRNRMPGFCFAVRLDIWKKYIHKFITMRTGGDHHFISECYANTINHFWLDRVIVRTQKKAGKGKGEHEHA